MREEGREKREERRDEGGGTRGGEKIVERLPKMKNCVGLDRE